MDRGLLFDYLNNAVKEDNGALAELVVSELFEYILRLEQANDAYINLLEDVEDKFIHIARTDTFYEFLECFCLTIRDVTDYHRERVDHVWDQHRASNSDTLFGMSSHALCGRGEDILDQDKKAVHDRYGVMSCQTT